MGWVAEPLIDLQKIFGNEPEKFDLTKIGDALGEVTNIMFGLAGTVALIFLLWGGILYLTAGGSSEQAGKAKSTLTWAIIGLIVVIAAYAIVKYFSDILILNSPTK